MNGLVGRLQLNPQVTIRPVADYPLTIQERLSGQVDDQIVSERRSRFSAIRVSDSVARLLKLFNTPRLVGEAVVELAEQLNTAPHDLLSEVFPVLVEMREASVLITEVELLDDPSSPRKTRLEPGDKVGGYTVLRALDATTETEIYEMVCPKGLRAALKLIPNTSPEFVQSAAKRECLVLPYLAEQGLPFTPRLLAEMKDSEAHYVFLSWIDGRSLNLAARDPTLGTRARLVLASRLAQAYASLHAVGVLHGDVHGGNVMVDEDGMIFLIDYGAADVKNLDLPDLVRIGLVESYEPEAAAELLAGHELPPNSAAGEQYALANLLTLTLTGRQSLILPLEHREALEEIVHQPPRAWDIYRSTALHPLELIISRGLKKSPTDRFVSISAFEDSVIAEINRVLPEITDNDFLPNPAASRTTPARLRAPHQAIRAQWGLGGDLIESGLPHAPNASIYYGAAGIALGLLRASVLAEDGELLAGAQVWIHQALFGAEESCAFDGPDLGISRKRIGTLSVLNNKIGLHYVEAFIAQGVDDKEGTGRAIRAFITYLEEQIGHALMEPSFGLDMAAGLPGLLIATLQLAGLPSAKTEDVVSLTAHAVALRERLLGKIANVCVAVHFDGAYLGIAHGLAGAVYALIESDIQLGLTADSRLIAAISALADQVVDGPNGMGWPIRLDTQPSLGWSGWCHGSAGHIQLWLAAAKVTQTRRCEELAHGAAEFAWKQRQDTGCSLCCGRAGLALSYEKLAFASGDVRWRRRAEALIFGERQDTRDLCAPSSLFRGLLGVELTRLELAAGGSGFFPLLDNPLG